MTSQVIAELENRIRMRKLWLEYGKVYDPGKPNEPGVYPWQKEFHDAGATHPERLMIAANRVGKTNSAAAETAIHLTGEYPPWWRGKRFDHPTRGWTGAERTEDSKDVVQVALLGPAGAHGTGWIPGSRIFKVTYRQAGVTEVVDSIYVKHKTGGLSHLTLKTYQQEAKGWRGAKLHFVWLDEECKQDIYTEAQTRVLDENGVVFMTFTPLLGPTAVVRHFMDGGPGIYMKNVSWDDAPHLNEEEKQRLMASYPAHERETRARGTPMLGTGAVFPISDDAISCDPFEIPKYFRRINGIDFGIDHPAAGAFLAFDMDSETCYVYDCYKAPGETPIYHAAAMKKHGKWIPNAWPHDGLQRDKGTGKRLKDLYREHGLFMTREHAQMDRDDKQRQAVEPGVIEMYEWMRTGRFKVFSNLGQWFEEKRLYHRREGKIVPEVDDILSATRYAFVMRRFARTEPPATIPKPKIKGPILGRRG